MTEETKPVKSPEDLVKESMFKLAMLHKAYKNFTYKIRKKHSAARVLETMLFADVFDVTLFGSEEKDLLDLAQEIMYNKLVVQKYIEQNGIEKLKTLVMEEKTNG